jgi:chloramphenicol-sensitive protein RarD
LVGKQWRAFTGAFNRRNVIILGSAAIFLSINWLVYVYAVDSNQVVQASLGYFMNPLISVAMGVILLKESLRKTQWFAVGIALVVDCAHTGLLFRALWPVKKICELAIAARPGN